MEKNPHDPWMRRAIELANEAGRADEVPVGAVVVQNGTIIAEARNEMESRKDVSAHAEILVLRSAAEKLGDWRLTDCTLYVTLEPCVMCSGAIVLARLSSVFFGSSDPRFGALGSLFNLAELPQLPSRPAIFGGLLADESQAVLSSFFRQRREKTCF